jgi:DNA mismatch repair protein MutS2
MIYPDNFETKIGFDRIRVMLSQRCLSPMGINLSESVTFLTNPDSVKTELEKTSEFQEILRFEEPFPSDNYFDVSGTLSKLRKEGTFPEVKEVFDLKRTLETIKAVINYLKDRKEDNFPILISLCKNIKFYPYVLDAIDRIIDRHGNIKDNASPGLRVIRSTLESLVATVSKKLNSILKQAQAEGIVDGDVNASVRNGRGVIPVNVYDKRKIKGLIHDQSASGKTVFIEPEEIVEINNEIIELEYEERREIVKILTALADDLRPYIEDLIELNGFLGEIDFIRAKALLGLDLGSIKPVLTEEPGLLWSKAVHPLLVLAFRNLPGREVVPLDIVLNKDERILLISGPNAGGKSVCLKTVGLLQYMLQCGLTIPVSEGSESGIFRNIFIDIGDEQSIDNDLSTYSSHLINMKYFLKNAEPGTLILIDEFGTGTEPILGGAIAEAILGELNKMGVFGVLTTHYTNLKHFASVTSGIVNGAMAFDNHIMQPLFQLSIGKPGSSFAFEIAKRIGLPEKILDGASDRAGVKNINYDRHLKDIARDKRYWENKRHNIRQHEKHLEELIDEYEKELSEVKSARKEIISKAKEEAGTIIERSNKLIENTIREIKEAQAEKERTREIRKNVEGFKEAISNKSLEESVTEKRFSRLEEKAVKYKPAKKRIIDKPDSIETKPLKPGDAVRMKDTMACGEVIEIRDDVVMVETGKFRIKVPLIKLEKISKAELRKSRKSTKPGIIFDDEITQKKIRFNPQIDVRGERGEEALRKVQDLLDNALIVQHKNLRILHGKGNGVLRELIRQYLSSVGFVKSYRDEHVEQGGSGITVVELDL